MIKPTVKFIHKLRVYLFLLIILIFFYQIGVNPVSLGKYIGAGFSSAIGMSTSVPENPFNKLAVQLKERQADLDEKEKSLNDWEKALEKRTDQTDIIIYLGFGIIILFILIIVNFYLDKNRSKK